MKTKSNTIITKTPRIWADADSYVSTPASDALEDELDEILVAVQRRERTLEDAFTETNDPGLALAFALRHGLRDCPNWSDPARLSRAIVQATTVLAARGELDDTAAWAVHCVTRLAFGDIEVNASENDLSARVLGACDEVAKRDARLALLLELGWECHLPAARARHWARATRLLRQASVVLRGEDRMLAHVLRAALPWYSMATAQEWEDSAPLGGRWRDGRVWVARTEWACHWTGIARDLGVSRDEIATALEACIARMRRVRGRCSKTHRARLFAERGRILEAYRSGTPERVSKLTGGGDLTDLPHHVIDFADLFERKHIDSDTELERANERVSAVLVPVLRATLPPIVIAAMSEHVHWRERLRSCGLDEDACAGIIDAEHAALARDRETVAPRRLRLVRPEPTRKAA